MQVLVNLGKLLEGEEESKKDDLVIGLHDESGSLYSPFRKKCNTSFDQTNTFCLDKYYLGRLMTTLRRTTGTRNWRSRTLELVVDSLLL